MAQNVIKMTFSKFYDVSCNCQKSSDGHPRAPVGPSDAPQTVKLYVKSMSNQTVCKIDAKLTSEPCKPKITKFAGVSSYISHVIHWMQ